MGDEGEKSAGTKGDYVAVSDAVKEEEPPRRGRDSPENDKKKKKKKKKGCLFLCCSNMQIGDEDEVEAKKTFVFSDRTKLGLVMCCSNLEIGHNKDAEVLADDFHVSKNSSVPP